ncbi:cation:H+ antiporter [Aquiflexum balticum DSM 16537]|uniref:Cation:H+ antiporter n=1 Tax=Aquiflexum balticum DSM 16537 TaxID=758820 RepID=A0A1W2H3E8_9BACT|nr:calcium/sodium antiporter [Aquiflexum balticum]SMD43158.1 cation:H+ antiporter [Aquiflexum balticum DSM 16537]
MDYLFLGIGLVILLAGGKYLVDGASGLAARFGLSPGLIGLTVVAFGTSAPELLVSINAAIKGSSDIAIGNVIGSNISNISMVLGISAVIFPIVIHRSVLKLDYLATLVSSLIFYLMATNGIISRWEGFILFVLFILINLYFFKKISQNEAQLDEFENVPSISFFKSILLFLIGVLGLYFGSDMLVDSAVNISKEMGISERIIGVTIIAIGTSLPELITSLIAALKKKTDIAIGNILGSNIQNIFSIIGLTALIRPINVSETFLNQDFIWMIGLTLLLFPIFRTNWRISRMEGLLLLILYCGYLYTVI